MLISAVPLGLPASGRYRPIPPTAWKYIVYHIQFRGFQQFLIFIKEELLLMALLLILDVINDSRNLVFAVWECAISTLPFKFSIRKPFGIDPLGWILLYFLHQIWERLSRSKTHEQMSGIPFICKSLCSYFEMIVEMYLYSSSFQVGWISEILFWTAKTAWMCICV